LHIFKNRYVSCSHINIAGISIAEKIFPGIIGIARNIIEEFSNAGFLNTRKINTGFLNVGNSSAGFINAGKMKLLEFD
uniref:Thiolase_C domain-containing protein n=1 Tax=Strongyloides papillosus TaxID=174720 RepID=A0A0N5BZE9_STREA